MSTRPAPDTDAAMVLGMASTALPFARSTQEEAERWLRILRMHGDAGLVLQALGVSEAPLESLGPEGEHEPPDGGRDIVAEVSEKASHLAGARGAPSLGTGDVLLAVMQVYGTDFDRVLRVHGTDHDEVLQRLGMEIPAAEL